MSTEILIFSPKSLASEAGNAVSARRMAARLHEAGLAALAVDAPPFPEARAAIFLNAWRSHAELTGLRRAKPSMGLAVVLTGTDIFPMFPACSEVVESLRLADWLVGYHEEVRPILWPEFQAKLRIIPKSVADAPPVTEAMRAARREAEFRVVVAGHLREVKDPFRAAAAARLLPAQSRVRILHLGDALSVEIRRRAEAEQRANPRYRWLGGVGRTAMFDHLGNAALAVNSSEAEGGANAVLEALAMEVPVLASHIPGNVGLLGSSYAGFFPFQDTQALADLLWRGESEPAFYGTLLGQIRQRAQLFSPEAERAGLAALADALLRR